VNKPSAAEAFIAPELAMLAALSTMLRCATVLLRMQHPQIDASPRRDDSRALRAARALAAHMQGTSRAVHRYVRATRSVVRNATVLDDELPF
jgi:hypothetical protein